MAPDLLRRLGQSSNLLLQRVNGNAMDDDATYMLLRKSIQHIKKRKKVSFSDESPLVMSRPRSSDRKRKRTAKFVPGEGGGQASGGSRRRKLDDIQEETTHCALLCHPVHCPCYTTVHCPCT